MLFRAAGDTAFIDVTGLGDKLETFASLEVGTQEGERLTRQFQLILWLRKHLVRSGFLLFRKPLQSAKRNGILFVVGNTVPCFATVGFIELLRSGCRPVAEDLILTA